MKNFSLATVYLVSALGLAAHDTWLQSPLARAAVGAEVPLELTSGNGFKGLQVGPQPDRIVLAVQLLAGQATPLVAGKVAAQVLPLTGRVPAAGVAGFAVELKPRDLELKPELIAEYLDEIHAGPELRAEWDARPAPKRWRERYAKCANTFVRIGEPGPADRSWTQPAGLTLELVPQQDPTTLTAGGVFRVRLLRQGQPLAALPIGFVADGETQHHVVVTDASGFAAAPLDHPGRWLIHGTDLRRSTRPDLEWESVFTTLVVNVAEPLPDAAPNPNPAPRRGRR